MRQIGSTSVKGIEREINQDAVISLNFGEISVEQLPDITLLIAVDGMGGHMDGTKAAELTIKTVASHVMKAYLLPRLEDESNNFDAQNILEAAAKEANRVVLKETPEAGACLTAMLLVGNQAHIVHVGDTRAYLITEESIEQLTKDHSLLKRLISLGPLGGYDEPERPERRVLYRAIGQNDALEPDTLTHQIPAQCHLLLCSIGIWQSVDDEQIADIVRSASSPQAACNTLVSVAEEGESKDDISVVICAV